MQIMLIIFVFNVNLDIYFKMNNVLNVIILIIVINVILLIKIYVNYVDLNIIWIKKENVSKYNNKLQKVNRMRLIIYLYKY